MRTLSVAASFANEQLSRDSKNTLEKMSQQDLPLPSLNLLQISNMKVTFSAFVTETDQVGFSESGGDLQLDFSKPGNFRGEITFSHFEPEYYNLSVNAPGNPASVPALNTQNGTHSSPSMNIEPEVPEGLQNYSFDSSENI